MISIVLQKRLTCQMGASHSQGGAPTSARRDFSGFRIPNDSYENPRKLEVNKGKVEYSTVKQSVDKGDKKAKTMLAWYKLSGLGEAAVDREGAVTLLEERVKAKDSEAMWMLGLCKLFGIGTEEDVDEANALFNKSGSAKNIVGACLGVWSGIADNVAQRALHIGGLLDENKSAWGMWRLSLNSNQTRNCSFSK